MRYAIIEYLSRAQRQFEATGVGVCTWDVAQAIGKSCRAARIELKSMERDGVVKRLPGTRNNLRWRLS